MTPSAIKKICQDCKGYGTAYLNDVLYLHHKVRAAQSGGSPTLLALRAAPPLPAPPSLFTPFDCRASPKSKTSSHTRASR